MYEKWGEEGIDIKERVNTEVRRHERGNRERNEREGREKKGKRG